MSARNPRTQRIRLFKSDRLERLTNFSPNAFCATWGAIIPLVAWAGWGAVSPLSGIGLVLSGLLFWTLFEYAMHRYLFHWDSDWKPVEWVVFLIHGNHHVHPNDRIRNLMPPVISVPVSALIWGACAALFGSAGTWIFLGFISGYVIYDLVHFACHQWPMRGALGMALKRHHMRHHHISEHGNFAISAIFWDRVFGSNIRSLNR
ncbi:MAG: fatty acid hydroxylase [Sphingomonas sanxanigenens]|uniref:Fatty acid hydroxylase n=1 Tax=Sphingomonas sanxanigenens TaxID=397260 RepID=A0A2W5C831_9SPHN|nr:MAG: fatty acid hydroxylase [Sphingomonas sanxanigenens]